MDTLLRLRCLHLEVMRVVSERAALHVKRTPAAGQPDRNN
jgi:hypothetical protein